MTNDKRLEQETRSGLKINASLGTHDYLSAQTRADELNAISPIFRRLQARKQEEPSAGQWQTFTIDLQRKLLTQDVPLKQTLRDRIASSDYNLVRWFLILLALVAMALASAAVAISYSWDPPPALAITALNEPGIAVSVLRPGLQPEHSFWPRQAL